MYSSATKRFPDYATINTNSKIYVNSSGKLVTMLTYFDGIARIWQHNSDKEYNALGNFTYEQKFNAVLIEIKAGAYAGI